MRNVNIHTYVNIHTKNFLFCFQLNGSSTNPTLTLIVTDSIKHIDKFVQKQKSSSMVKM